MADITVRNQGEVDNSGKVNWRGDQVSLPQGGQSIYKSSTVKLAELGSRKVVGDRVFRYAKCFTGATAIGAGDVAENQGEFLEATGGGTNAADGKTFTFYAATAIAKDTYAEGYLNVVTAGHFYRIKSNDAISSAGTGTLYLYDPIVDAEVSAAEYAIQQNPYLNTIECTTGDATLPLGVAPIAATTADYYWLQTWGPCNVKCGAALKGDMMVADVTGQVIAFNNFESGVEMPIIGHMMMDATASEYGVMFLQIAP